MAFLYPWGNSQQLNLDWILQKIKDLESGGMDDANLQTIANALIAHTYSASTQYRRYDYCFYNGKLYRAETATSGAFNQNDWQEVVLGDDIPILTRLLNAVDASVTILQTALENLGSDDVTNDSTVPGDDVTDALDNLQGTINNVQGQITAYVQTSATATRNYKVGDYLVYNNTLYRVTNAITSGTSITNKISATTIGNEIGLTTYNASDVVTTNVTVEIYKSGHFVEINCFVNTATGVSIGAAWQDLMTIPAEIAPKLQTRFTIINYLDGNIYQARLINGTGKLQVYMPSAGTFLPAFTFIYLVE